VQFGTQVVLEDLSLELGSGETVGLIGANGVGKTTLFRLIAGELQADLGTVTLSKGLKIGYLKQEPDVGLERTLHDEVGSVFADLLALEKKLHAASEEMAGEHDEAELARLMARYERINEQFIAAGGYGFETRLNEIMGGLGFSPADYALPMSVLSGGQKCRSALAKMLLQDCPMLLLDEPTNHLDIDAVRWLEKFLAGHHGGAVVISHDRYLLDRLADRIVEVERRHVFSYPGNYSNYAQAKQMLLLTEQRRYQKDTEFVKKEREFITKHIAGQRTKEAQGRRKRLDRRLAAGEFVTDKSATTRKAKITFKAGEDRGKRRGHTVVRCEELTMQYDDNVLFTDLSLQIETGDRFGITGPNGTGKSTLLKIILGEVQQVGGKVEVGAGFKIGYYDQEHGELDLGRTVVEEIRTAAPEMTEQAARSLLARYLFSGEDVYKQTGQLSGGEQSRVRLAKLILAAPDVLVLDEPTNHLDIPSREALEESLLEFGGTIIVVSHDRYFLDRIADRLLVIRADRHTTYAGNYSYYIEQIEREQRGGAPTKVSGKKKRSRAQREDVTPKRKSSPYDRLGVEELEEMIIAKEEQLALISERFGDPEVCKDPDLLDELKEETDALSCELAQLDEAWQERVDLE